MNIDNEGHQIYLWKLLARLKFQEFDEYELRQFIQSPYGTEILKKLLTESTNKFIPKDIGVVDDRTLRLIIKRVDDWEESQKERARNWTESEARDYLVSMIEPFKFTDDIITRLTTELNEQLKK